MDPFGTGKTLPPLQLPQPTSSQSTITPLKKPPKWIRRPVGASFAVSGHRSNTVHFRHPKHSALVLNQLSFCEQFGGKLVTLDNKPSAHVVHVSQVVTETDFIDRSNQLQATLNEGNFLEYCQTKIEAAQNEFEKTIWSFLKVGH